MTPPATTEARPTPRAPRAFLSYAWDTPEHQAWVRDLATRLRHDGITTTLDQWELQPGDQLTHFMEQSVRDNDYILIICTPRYAQRSNNRTGGVGYEGDIMTAELLTNQNQRKFIPILRNGNDQTAIPTWLQGKYRIDLRNNPYSEEQYEDLTTTIHGLRPTPPPVGTPPTRREATTPQPTTPAQPPPAPTAPEPIKILGIIADNVTMPRNDGTRGSALYTIPFQLSRRPDHTWSTMFIEHWNHPPRFTTMHRPGIGRISGDRFILDGTTIEEVQQVHRETLKLAIQETNREYDEYQARENARREREQQERKAHEEYIRNKSKRITFD